MKKKMATVLSELNSLYLSVKNYISCDSQHSMNQMNIINGAS